MYNYHVHTVWTVCTCWLLYEAKKYLFSEKPLNG